MDELLSQITSEDMGQGLGEMSDLAYSITYSIILTALVFIVTSIAYRVAIKYFDRESNQYDLFQEKAFLRIMLIVPIVGAILSIIAKLYLIDLYEMKKMINDPQILESFFYSFLYLFFCEVFTFYTYKFIFNLSEYEFGTFKSKFINFMAYSFLTTFYLYILAFFMIS